MILIEVGGELVPPVHSPPPKKNKLKSSTPTMGGGEKITMKSKCKAVIKKFLSSLIRSPSPGLRRK